MHLRNRSIKRFVPFIMIAIIVIGLGIIFTRTASFQRFVKSVKSDYTGGLERTVTVYDGNGNVLKEWSGKIDIQESDYGNKVLFELDGKRKAVYNAEVIVEEK